VVAHKYIRGFRYVLEPLLVNFDAVCLDIDDCPKPAYFIHLLAFAIKGI
jgi:hypothetical protein